MNSQVDETWLEKITLLTTVCNYQEMVENELDTQSE